MNKGLWIARKNYLWCMIKKISAHHGGDDTTWLQEHFRQVLEAFPEERLEEAIKCYEEMVEQLKLYPKRNADD